MAKIENQFADIVLSDPAVAGVVGFAGATDGNSSENIARMFIQLKPLSERDASAQQVIQRLRPKVTQARTFLCRIFREPFLKRLRTAAESCSLGATHYRSSY